MCLRRRRSRPASSRARPVAVTSSRSRRIVATDEHPGSVADGEPGVGLLLAQSRLGGRVVRYADDGDPTLSSRSVCAATASASHGCGRCRRDGRGRGRSESTAWTTNPTMSARVSTVPTRKVRSTSFVATSRRAEGPRLRCRRRWSDGGCSCSCQSASASSCRHLAVDLGRRVVARRGRTPAPLRLHRLAERPAPRRRQGSRRAVDPSTSCTWMPRTSRTQPRSSSATSR